MGGKRRSRSGAELAYDVIIGTNIVNGRKKAGISAAILAERIGVTRSQLYFYESGEHRCPVYRLALIAGVLGIQLASLVPNPSQNRFPARHLHGTAENV